MEYWASEWKWQMDYIVKLRQNKDVKKWWMAIIRWTTLLKSQKLKPIRGSGCHFSHSIVERESDKCNCHKCTTYRMFVEICVIDSKKQMVRRCKWIGERWAIHHRVYTIPYITQCKSMGVCAICFAVWQKGKWTCYHFQGQTTASVSLLISRKPHLNKESIA